jgi:hypothetical protein
LANNGPSRRKAFFVVIPQPPRFLLSAQLDEIVCDFLTVSIKWCGNALRFATREEAEANVRDLMMLWFAVRETRVVESDDPVNYRYVSGRLESLKPEELATVK